MARLFGTDGVRGLANVAPMSPEVVMELGRAAVQVLAHASPEGKPSLLVGCDTRLSSPMFEAALVAGICSAGARCPASRSAPNGWSGLFGTPYTGYRRRNDFCLA